MFPFNFLSRLFEDLSFDLADYLPENPYVTLVPIIAAAHVLYYLQKVVHKPQILVKQNSKFHQFLIEHCPSSIETYTPPLWCYGSLAQTIMRPIICKLFVPDIVYNREILELPDGGVIALDHYGGNYQNLKTDIVMIMTGLTGCSQAEYIRQFCICIRRSGKHPVVVNYRGAGGVPLKTAKTYCSTHPEDFAFAVEHMKRQNPNSKIMGLGISLGGMILTHYLLQTPKSDLCGGMAISPAWNPHESTKSLERPINWFVFNQMLSYLLCGLVKKHRPMFEKAGYDVDKITRSRSVREFDTSFTSKAFGYKTNDDYYDDAAFDKKLHSIQVPMLYLNAADDMFCPRDTINDEFLYNSESVACIMTEKGGHIGFLDGIFPGPVTYMNRLFIQFMNAIFDHGEELAVTGSN